MKTEIDRNDNAVNWFKFRIQQIAGKKPASKTNEQHKTRWALDTFILNS